MRKSTAAIEGELKISSFIKIPLLLDVDEMASFLTFLQEQNDFSFYNTFGLCQDGGIFKSETFLTAYKNYIEALKNKELKKLKTYYPFFSHSLSVTSDIFYEVELENSKRVIRPVKPPIQLQPHEFIFSQETETFYSMVYSENSISFGIQISYPNLMQDAKTFEVLSVDETFPNTSFFKKMRLWIRENTLPTPFVVNEKKHNLPYRIGKSCLSWINTHPQLEKHGIYVKKSQAAH